MGDIPSTTSITAVAVVAGSFLSGGMMSISINAVPVMLGTITDSSQLLQQWARTFYYGIRTFPTISVTTALLYGTVAMKRRLAKRSWGIYALSATVTLAMVPFTWALMDPTNQTLFGLGAESVSGADINLSMVKDLVRKWSLLHVIRSLFPLAGAAIGMYATLSHYQ